MILTPTSRPVKGPCGSEPVLLSRMAELPIEILALAPLALAAGVDLYLTLLLLGAAPTTGLWETPLPGALGDLDPPGVLLMLGAFYLLEFAAERFSLTALVWNAFHAIIRPVSGALLALLLLDGQSTAVIVAGCIVGSLLASGAHAVRSGWAVLRWLDDDEPPSVLLLSLLEDVAVLGVVSLTLDAPEVAAIAAGVVVVVGAPFAPSYARAFRHAIVLAARRVFVSFGLRRWRGPDEMPSWVPDAFADQVEHPSGGAMRGAQVGARHLPGAPRFAVGWLVMNEERPFFVHMVGRARRRVDLTDAALGGVRDADFFRRVDLRDRESRGYLIFDRGGPSAQSLRSEFPDPIG